MASNFVPLLDLEIKRLEQVIEGIPDVRRLAELKRVRALYPTVHNVSMVEGIVATDTSSAPVTKSVPGRKMAPERQRALDFVTILLKQEPFPVRTSSLSGALQQKGINIGGSDPVNSLSALLSTSGQFQAHGRSGWTIKLTPEELTENTASNPPGKPDIY